MKQKKVVVVTHVLFWLKGGGDKTRIHTLVRFLSSYTEVIVVLIAKVSLENLRRFDQTGLNINLVILDNPQYAGPDGFDPRQYEASFRQYMAAAEVDVCIIEYVFLAFLLESIPPGVKTFLDVHDIIGDRKASFRKCGVFEKQPTDISEELERSYFKKFDTVIAIHEQDYHRLCQVIDRSRLIIAHHPAELTRKNIRKTVKNVGFVGSYYPPNVDGINWFLRQVWPRFRNSGITLNLYGEVHYGLHLTAAEDVVVHGLVPNIEEVYDQIDVVINPVRCGAGLKIKSVEALGAGLPLVTTSHGGRGLEAGAGTAFLVADEPGDFYQALVKLCNDLPLRRLVSEAAFGFAQREFSPHACFRQLLTRIGTETGVPD